MCCGFHNNLVRSGGDVEPRRRNRNGSVDSPASRGPRSDCGAFVGRINIRANWRVDRIVCSIGAPPLCEWVEFASRTPGRTMSITPAHLKELETSLASLAPSAIRLNRDRLLYEAGQRTAPTRM